MSFDKLWVCLFCTLLISCKTDTNTEVKPTTDSNKPKKTAYIPFTVTRTIPHRTDYFTQGLQVVDGQLMESTGSPVEFPQTESVISMVNLQDGSVNERVRLDKKIYFGEGITVLNDRIYQVTYKNQKGFIYDLKTFKQIGTFTYTNKEGWGLTNDGTHIIMSDGSNHLTYFMPPDMKVVKKVAINDEDNYTGYLNELEYVNGMIYANVWQTPIILKIDPENGSVVGRLDLTELKRDADAGSPYAEVPNGIAYDSVSGKFYVTGKMWPKIYELKID